MMRLKWIREKHNQILIVFIGLSIILRLIGIKIGLPYFHHPDEWTKVEPAVRMVADGTLNPGWLGHPGSTLIYPLAAIYKIWFAIFQGGRFFSADPRLYDFLYASGEPLFLIARLLNAAYNVLLVPLVYALVKKLTPNPSNLLPLLAAGIISIEPANVYWSHIARTDTCVTFFVTLAVFFALLVYERPTIVRVIFAGLVCGLAVSSKYAAAPVGFTIPVALFLARQKGEKLALQRWIGLSFLAALFTVIGFALTTPYFFLDFELTRKSAFATLGSSSHLGADGLSFFGNLWFYLGDAFPDNMTWPLYISGFIGLIWFIFEKNNRILIPLAFVVLYMLTICVHPLHWTRWVVPVIPILAIGTSFFIVSLSNVLSQWAGKRNRFQFCSWKACIVLVSILVLALPVSLSIKQDVQFSTKDTRVTAKEWIDENIPAGSKFATEEYAAPISNKEYDIEYFFSLSERDLAYYTNNGFNYLMLSSSVYNRYYREPDRYQSTIEFYDGIRMEFPLIKKISTDGWWQTGPTIQIYSLPENP